MYKAFFHSNETTASQAATYQRGSPVAHSLLPSSYVKYYSHTPMTSCLLIYTERMRSLIYGGIFQVFVFINLTVTLFWACAFWI